MYISLKFLIYQLIRICYNNTYTKMETVRNIETTYFYVWSIISRKWDTFLAQLLARLLFSGICMRQKRTILLSGSMKATPNQFQNNHQYQAHIKYQTDYQIIFQICLHIICQLLHTMCRSQIPKPDSILHIHRFQLWPKINICITQQDRL